MKAIDQIVFVMGGAAIPSHLRQPRQPRLGGMPAPIAAVDFPEQFVRRARPGGMGARADRGSVVSGKSGSGRVARGGSRRITIQHRMIHLRSAIESSNNK